MATIHHDQAADLSLIQAKKIAIIGYGSQGHAHALNLRDSGCNVCIGLHPDSQSREKAVAAGLTVRSNSEAAAWADVIMILAPDTSQQEIYEKDLAPHLSAGKMLMFAHGFNIRYGTIHPPKDIDVTMIAPKAPGHRVREVFVEGGGTPCPARRPSGRHRQGQATGALLRQGHWRQRAGVMETTFTEETETDLFGEQAVLCGGVSALMKAGFDTLVEAGYQPEAAYFECVHEMKLIVDLIYQGGLNYMRYSISDTAEWGDYTAGPQVIGPDSKRAMKDLLTKIQNGEFAAKWIAENKTGRHEFDGMRQKEQHLLVEQIGARLRAMMPFLNPVTVKIEPESGAPPTKS